MSYSAPPPPPEDPGSQPAESSGGYDAAPPPPPPTPSFAGAPAAPAAPAGDYAVWILRVQSALVDWVGGFVVAMFLFFINDALGWLAYLAAIGWAIYNAYIQGVSGQSTGKKMVGTKVIGLATGQPIGAGMSIARYFLHIVDGLPCYLGYLWPLWDDKRQTFADKIVSSVVVKA